jgi:hypothetical protein
VSDAFLHCTGIFTRIISLTFDRNVLNLSVDNVEQIGQQIKRAFAVSALKAADDHNAETTQKRIRFINMIVALLHHCSPPFWASCSQTYSTFDPKTGKTIILSTHHWNTQQNRHSVSSLRVAACNVAQELSYHKTQEYLSEAAGVNSLFSALCV